MTQDKAAAPDIKAIRAAATRREVAVRICVAGELSADAERLDAELRRLDALTKTSLADGGERARLVEELDAVIALMRENEFEFRFRALPSASTPTCWPRTRRRSPTSCSTRKPSRSP